MVQDSSQILATTWSSVQASLSVILVLLYGYLARAYKLVSQAGEDNMSNVSVTLFLPALLFSEIGPLASWSNIKEYWIIIVYSILFQLVSWVFGALGVAVFKMPQWIVPCMVFNNATSLPLLLLSSLSGNGTLDPLLLNGDSMKDVLSRGRVYLLINALVCNLARFTFGPYLMKAHPSKHAWTHFESPFAVLEDVKTSIATTTVPSAQTVPTAYPDVDPYAAETTPLLHKARVGGSRAWMLTRRVWKATSGYFNPPMIGGLAAVVAGVIPFLHRWLFNTDAILSPFSKSIENIGGLYAVLQMFVLGAHLRSKKGSRPPIFPLVYLFIYRFAVIPVISTSVIYGVRRVAGSRILADPVLDFTMAIAPVGPPALTLAAIVEMSGTDDSVESAVAQTIVISYILTPLISFSVTGALSVVEKLYP